MLTAFALEKLLETGQYRQVIRRVLSNGRTLPAEVRVLFLSPVSASPGESTSQCGPTGCQWAALGLGIQRWLELAYCIDNSLARRLHVAAEIIDGLRRDGRTLSGSHLAAASTIVRALWMARDMPGSEAISEPDWQAVMTWVWSHRTDDVRFVGSDAGTIAVLWQVGDIPAFADAGDVRSLATSLDGSGNQMLRQFALAIAA